MATEFVDVVHPEVGRARMARSAFEHARHKGWELADNDQPDGQDTATDESASRDQADPDPPSDKE